MPFNIFKRQPKQPDSGLERGWQFYARPNTLEPVGYVFRIDEHGVRFPVTQFPVETVEGVEAGVKVQQRIELKAGVLARFLELLDLSADTSAGRARVLDFEIHEPIRVSSMDVAIEGALRDFLDGFTAKKGHRYYVIRQTRSATSMTYSLTSEFLAELGGEAEVSAGLKAGARLKVAGGDRYEIHQEFPERMLVTFQPERIERVSFGLAEGGAFGLTPVADTLDWREPPASLDTGPEGCG